METVRRICTLAVVAASLLVFSVAQTYGQNNKNNSNYNNGKPFSEINAALEALSAEVSVAIADLQATVDDLQASFAAIELTVDGLDQRIAVNTAEINGLLSDVAALEAAVNANRDGLEALTARHEADILAIRAEIAVLRLRVSQLRSDLTAAVVQLNGEIERLDQAVADNTDDISDLLASVTSMLARIVAIDATLNGHESRIDDLETGQSALSALVAQLQDQINALGGRLTTAEGDIATLQSFHLTQFSGVRTNVPLAELNGWEQCHLDTYGTNTGSAFAAGILANCTKANILLACRLTGSDTLSVVAHAPRGDVFFDTGTGNTPHNANGVDWYFNTNFSMGFAHQGDGISRRQCDTATGSFPGERLCWHTLSSFSSGWRCGTARNLNNSNSFERIVLQAD